ncbi:MAG: insulinase family protein, partial [Planctomycetes bacterium]|nr:insulinase family protein [Planctomycetota bacterium]
VLVQKMAAVAYEWHNYGQATIGNRSDIERVPLPKLRDFYRRYYQPDNAMLVIAGSFDQDKALEYVQKYFGAIPRPQRQLDRTYTEEPPQDGPRTVILRRVGDVSLVGVAYHVPSGPDPEYAAIEVLSYILATEPAGRLYKALVETQKASSVFGWVRPQHDPGLMYMMAEVRKDGSVDDVRDTMLATIESLGQEGPTREEVDRVRQQILKQRELEMSDSAQVAIDLSNWASQGDWRLFFLYRDRIEQVTPEQVKAAAAKYCRPNNRTVGLFVPTEKADRIPVPPRPDIAGMVKDYRGREAVAEGEQFDPSPENIDARTRRFVLPGGIQVALLPKKTRGESVHLKLDLRYGNAENLRGFETAGDLLPRLMARGTKTLTYQQLQDELDKNRASLNAGGGVGVASFTIETKGPQLPAVLELLRQVLREPSLPAAELEVLRREDLAQLESAQTDPQSLAGRRLRRLLQPYPKGDVRYTPTIAEEIGRIQEATLDQIKTLYGDYVGNQAGQLALVGDFDAAEIQPVLELIFADWSAKKDYAHIKREAFAGAKGQVVRINTPDKANAVYYAGLMLAMKDTDDEFPALVLGNFVLGGGSLSSRLGTRVRQKEGLSYGVFSGFSADALDPVARLTIAAIANPDNVPKVQVAIREEIDRLLQDGIPAEELAQAKSGYLQRQAVARTNDGQLVAQLAESLEAGRTMAYYGDLEADIAGLSAEEIVAAMREYFVPDDLIVVLAGDFEKAEKPKE